MIALDEIDRRLIAALRAEGRALVSRLAASLRVSPATVESRMRRLAERGVIRGYTVRLVGEEDGSVVRALMSIGLIGRSTAAVIRNLHIMPEITSLHTTNGAWVLIAEIRTATLPDFDRVLREVRGIEGVLNSEISLLLNSA